MYRTRSCRCCCGGAHSEEESTAGACRQRVTTHFMEMSTKQLCARTPCSSGHHGLASERSGGGADKGSRSCEAGAGTYYDSMIGSIPAMLTHRARPLPRSCTNVCAGLMRGKEGERVLAERVFDRVWSECASPRVFEADKSGMTAPFTTLPSALQRMYVRDCALAHHVGWVKGMH